jgi:hypothetical protein
MRQQKMLESVGQIQSRHGQGLVVYTLALMWPLLLLSMGLTYFLQRKRRLKRLSGAQSGSSRAPVAKPQLDDH